MSENASQIDAVYRFRVPGFGNRSPWYGAAAQLENRQTRETGFQDRSGRQRRGEVRQRTGGRGRGRGREDEGQRMGGQPGSGASRIVMSIGNQKFGIPRKYQNQIGIWYFCPKFLGIFLVFYRHFENAQY